MLQNKNEVFDGVLMEWVRKKERVAVSTYIPFLTKYKPV